MATNHIISKDDIRREEQLFFVNGRQIYGLQDLSLSYENNSRVLKYLGMSGVHFVPEGEEQGSVSLSYLVVGSDPFLQFTGFSGFNGYTVKSRASSAGFYNFSFTSGYVTEYNATCAIGEIPQVSVNVQTFGNIGRLSTTESADVISHLSTISSSAYDLNPKIAGPGSMTLNLDEFTTNRLLSYNISCVIPRNPIYAFGSRYPTTVEINWPIEVNVGLSYALNDYSPSALRSYPCNPTVKTVDLSVKSFDTNASITRYLFGNMFLTSESQETNVDGFPVINVNYRTFMERPR